MASGLTSKPSTFSPTWCSAFSVTRPWLVFRKAPPALRSTSLAVMPRVASSTAVRPEATTSPVAALAVKRPLDSAQASSDLNAPPVRSQPEATASVSTEPCTARSVMSPPRGPLPLASMPAPSTRFCASVISVTAPPCETMLAFSARKRPSGAATVPAAAPAYSTTRPPAVVMPWPVTVMLPCSVLSCTSLRMAVASLATCSMRSMTMSSTSSMLMAPPVPTPPPLLTASSARTWISIASAAEPMPPLDVMTRRPLAATMSVSPSPPSCTAALTRPPACTTRSPLDVLRSLPSWIWPPAVRLRLPLPLFR